MPGAGRGGSSGERVLKDMVLSGGEGMSWTGGGDGHSFVSCWRPLGCTFQESEFYGMKNYTLIFNFCGKLLTTNLY